MCVRFSLPVLISEMQSVLPSTLRTIVPAMAVPAAALSTSAKLDQAYSVEADTFGELKVRKSLFFRTLAKSHQQPIKTVFSLLYSSQLQILTDHFQV